MSNQNALQVVSDVIYGVRESFEQVAVDRSINFVREAEFAIQQIGGNDYSISVARSNPQSVMDAVRNVAAIGISLNPAKKQAYLVPRKSKVCLDISYMGLLDLAVASGSILWGQAELVHESDDFVLNGFDKAPTHGRAPFAKDRGAVVGAYVVVKTHSGDYLTETMTIDEINDIRDRTESWKAWVEKQKKSPWVTDAGEMQKKTVIKRAYKTWPKTDRLAEAIHYLNTDGEEGIPEAQKRSVGCDEHVLSTWVGKAKTAVSSDELTKVWTDGLAVIKPTGDLRAYNQFKDAVSARGVELKSGKKKDEGAIDVEAREVPADDLQADFDRQMRAEQAAEGDEQ
ncbi:recombinase RecT [Pararobbsia silviterrae]|uniref:DNA recombinase n=1 Tax=Pararobbsia silviterrae TaxID=1792498 RepID=A0A494Y703_9BURK|nr:recombinase RecT [Pararobbsia silviterrae]RKP56391.1 DNA recombinase [Pararobbsia silviterrae]